MSESRNRTCGTCRSFTRDPECEHIGVCWSHYMEDGEGNDCYLSVRDIMNACDLWESVSSGPVGGEVVFVSNCDREALLSLADRLEDAILPGSVCDRCMRSVAAEIREACGHCWRGEIER